MTLSAGWHKEARDFIAKVQHRGDKAAQVGAGPGGCRFEHKAQTWATALHSKWMRWPARSFARPARLAPWAAASRAQLQPHPPRRGAGWRQQGALSPVWARVWRLADAAAVGAVAQAAAAAVAAAAVAPVRLLARALAPALVAGSQQLSPWSPVRRRRARPGQPARAVASALSNCSFFPDACTPTVRVRVG